MIPRLSTRRQRQLTRIMQLILAIMLVTGLVHRNLLWIGNAGIALLVTFVPALLKHDFRVPIDPWIGLWMTTAVFLHALGLFGTYRSFWWWDHLTHTLSAAVIAGAGYVTVRALDDYADTIHFPARFISVYILIFVLAFGVLWEILEYNLHLASVTLIDRAVITTYGVTDTVIDLVFDLAGGLVVALYGHAYLNEPVTGFREYIERRYR